MRAHRFAETNRLLCASTLFESAHVLGLDLFCTRVAPSLTVDVLSVLFNMAHLEDLFDPSAPLAITFKADFQYFCECRWRHSHVCCS